MKSAVLLLLGCTSAYITKKATAPQKINCDDQATYNHKWNGGCANYADLAIPSYNYIYRGKTVSSCFDLCKQNKDCAQFEVVTDASNPMHGACQLYKSQCNFGANNSIHLYQVDRSSQQCQAKNDQIDALNQQILEACQAKRESASDCDAQCDGETPREFQIYQLQCQLGNINNATSCIEERQRTLDCDMSCPGADPKKEQIAKLECTLARIHKTDEQNTYYQMMII